MGVARCRGVGGDIGGWLVTIRVATADVGVVWLGTSHVVGVGQHVASTTTQVLFFWKNSNRYWDPTFDSVRGVVVFGGGETPVSRVTAARSKSDGAPLRRDVLAHVLVHGAAVAQRGAASAPRVLLELSEICSVKKILL